MPRLKSGAPAQNNRSGILHSGNGVPGQASPPTVERGIEDLLFFSEPNPVEKKAVFLLDRGDAVKEAMAKTSFVTVSRPEPPRQWGIKDMQGGFRTLSEAVIIIREDGSTGRPKPPAADIRARFHGSRALPQGIRADLPQLPEALKTLKPVPVLDIVERGNVTDFKPGWHYGGVFVTAARRSDIIMGPGKKARPPGLRDRRKEEEQFLRLEEILADNLSRRRGRYASLSGDASAPLRLEMPMSEVLASYGKQLMETGAEIGLEDRPVKLADSLSLHTRREGLAGTQKGLPLRIPGNPGGSPSLNQLD